MIEIRCLEGTFGCKSYDLSDWYRLYIGCKKKNIPGVLFTPKRGQVMSCCFAV